MVRRFLGDLFGLPRGPAETHPVEHHVVHGLPVRVLNTRPEIQTAAVIQRLTAALDLIARYAPVRYRRLRHDLSGFVVQRFACRGAFLPDTRECLTELTFTVNPRHGLPE